MAIAVVSDQQNTGMMGPHSALGLNVCLMFFFGS